MLEKAFVRSDAFDSFFMGGFECSTHCRRGGVRLDLLAATGHDRTALSDYQQLGHLGLKTFRDGLRWHLVETSPGRYDWSSFLAMLRAANLAGVQIIWDLFHYGWPDDIDIFAPSFIGRFERFSAAAARLIRSESDAVPFYCPVNEISYFAWAGGDKKLMNPFCQGQADALKQQLVRACIAAIEAVRSVDPRARIVHAEPAINVVGGSRRDEPEAAAFNISQYQSTDMIGGRLESGLGGKPEYLDLLGVNYYPDNQWFLNGGTIPMGHHSYRPLRELLGEIHARYRRPLFIAETGAEGTARPAWLYYVVREVAAAKQTGADLQGVCLYPVTDYPGWENGRPCNTGVLSGPDASGRREFFRPLVDQLFASAAELRQLCRDERADVVPAMFGDARR
jgi:hypothetical protein